MTIGGLPSRQYLAAGTHTFETTPDRPDSGGGYVDSVLYVINPTVGGTSMFDDDSGLDRLSKTTANLTCAPCWMVAGTYLSEGTGTDVELLAYNFSSGDSDGDDLPNDIEISMEPAHSLRIPMATEPLTLRRREGSPSRISLGARAR